MAWHPKFLRVPILGDKRLIFPLSSKWKELTKELSQAKEPRFSQQDYRPSKLKLEGQTGLRDTIPGRMLWSVLEGSKTSIKSVPRGILGSQLSGKSTKQP